MTAIQIQTLAVISATEIYIERNKRQGVSHEVALATFDPSAEWFAKLVENCKETIKSRL
jgi:hypothetical protein